MVGGGSNSKSSFCSPGALCRLWLCVREFNPRAGSVAVYKRLVGDPSYIGLGHGVHFLELVEELAPVAIAGLVLGELVCEALVIGESAQQVGLGSGLVAGHLLVGDWFVLHTVHLLLHLPPHLLPPFHP